MGSRATLGEIKIKKNKNIMMTYCVELIVLLSFLMEETPIGSMREDR
jgi:hypothetical protein